MSKLIVLEGIDGSGTTTQAARLVAALLELGVDAHATREPSTGPVGRLIREMLIGQHQPVDQTTFGLLFAADRADHLQREVEPALARGAVVISDRYYHSSLAYQADDGNFDWVSMLNSKARNPDLTFFLQVEAELGAARRAAAGRPEELFDHIEKQRRVVAGYRRALERLEKCGELIVWVDGAMEMDAIHTALLDHTLKVLHLPADYRGHAAAGPAGERGHG